VILDFMPRRLESKRSASLNIQRVQRAERDNEYGHCRLAPKLTIPPVSVIQTLPGTVSSIIRVSPAVRLLTSW
jgi:hypothetical protein